MTAHSGDKQAETWELLYEQIVSIVKQYGTEDFRDTADCWVEDDNLGTLQEKVYVSNLTMLRPVVIKSLQQLLTKFPDWEIRVAVSGPERWDQWPIMGLTIRAHEIIDGLQRRYFPPEFRDIHYEGSRPGTEHD
jgi:hypothetical protein